MRSRARWGSPGLPALALLVVLGWGVGVPASGAGSGPPKLPVAPPLRESSQGTRSPTLSFIDSQTPTCHRAEKLSETCLVDWVYLYVTADGGQYMLDMTVEIGGRLRAVHQGFFQTYMYIPSDLHGEGFAVACGHPGAGGDPARGNLWPFTIRARETGGLSTTNYGSVYCPFTLHLFSDDFESGDTTAWSIRIP